MTTQYLFNRSWAVTIATGNGNIVRNYSSIPVNNVTTALRTQFEFDKNMFGTSNKGKIALYNMSIQSRQLIKKGMFIQVQAGYQGLVKTIFTGIIVTPISKRNGSDIVTIIEAGDAESVIFTLNYDKGYPPGTALYQILQDIASKLKAYGVNTGIILGIPNETTSNGVNLTGPIRNSLDILLKPHGLEWNIQDGNFNIVPLGATINGTGNVEVVSSLTGMIDVPSSNNGYVQFKTLLNPKITPGCQIELLSNNTALNGFYKIRRIKIEGDTHDSKWFMDCEAVPIGQTVQYASNQGSNFGSAVA